MAMLHPVSVSPMQWFYPIGTTSATSLTQDLPPETTANCLLLGTGDPRDILFTLYNDLNKGIYYYVIF